jgi:dTDP-3-amino-3,4,6-trideoxy-alpha-D-glucose transaminase
MLSVPFNDFARCWEDLRPDLTEAFDRFGASGWYILGRSVLEFETALAARWGLAHAVGVASGHDAIQIALRVVGCGPGSKVLTTPISAFATTLAVVNCGATPVFADSGECGLIDLDACEEALDRDRGIRFFVPVHLYGHCLDLERLEKLRDRYGVFIVEDCAQSIGAGNRGRQCGTAAHIAATSFYPTKNLGGMGDGGAILTQRGEYAAAARQFRDYGQSSKYRHEVIGYNSRLDELQAALLLAGGIRRLDAWTERRRQLARFYTGALRNPAIRVPPAPDGSESVWHLFPVLVARERKPEFREYLGANGVGTAEHYPTPLFDQPAMRHVPFETASSCDRAREFCASEVSLPLHPYLTDEEAAHVVEVCNRWGI